MEYSQVSLLGQQGCFQECLAFFMLGTGSPWDEHGLGFRAKAAADYACCTSNGKAGAPFASACLGMPRPSRLGFCAETGGLLPELLLRQHGGQELPGEALRPLKRSRRIMPAFRRLTGSRQELHTPKARGACRGCRLCACNGFASTGTEIPAHRAQEDCRTSTVRRICVDLAAHRFSCPMAQSLQQPLAGQLSKVFVAVARCPASGFGIM